MSMEYKVPRLLWENLESVLLAQSKRYICELAKRLSVPEKELIKRVLPNSDSLKVIIQDSQSVTNQCKAYIQHDKLTVFCRKSVVNGCEYCAFHRNKRMSVIQETEPITIKKLKDNNMREEMWLQNNNIINSSGNIIGKVNKSHNRVKLFIIES
jgi:hypothetical protein